MAMWRHGDTGRGHAVMKTQMGVMHLQAQLHFGVSLIIRSQETGMGQTFLQSPQQILTLRTAWL